MRRGTGDLRPARARSLAEEEAVEVVVGLPRSLSGGEGPAAAKVREFAARLARRGGAGAGAAVDERLTTVSAEAMLRDRGPKGAKRRAVVDQAAAVVILQHALDTERATGTRAGRDRRVRERMSDATQDSPTTADDPTATTTPTTTASSERRRDAGLDAAARAAAARGRGSPGASPCWWRSR